MIRRVVPAYHEAGHALWAHQLGFRIVFVSIIPDAVTLGRVRATDWVLDHVAANQPERLVEAVTASLGVKLGGPLAELVLQPGKTGVSAPTMLQRARSCATRTFLTSTRLRFWPAPN